MAKPQFILAVDYQFLLTENIKEGFQLVDQSAYTQMLKNAMRHLTIRQRDYLDGVGLKGLKEAIESAPGGYTFKGKAIWNQDTSELILPNEEVVSKDSPETDIYLGIKKDIGLMENSDDNQLFNIVDGKAHICFLPKELGLEPNVFINGDNLYRQLLPYTVFKVKGKNKYFTYRRTTKVGEARLSGNCSIGFGGHVDLADVVFDSIASTIDLPTTLFDASLRELNEELQISDELHDLVVNETIEPVLFGLVNDNSNSVGQLHLGIVNVYEVNEQDIVDVNEDELEFLGALTPNEILNNNPESWTAIIIKELSKIKELKEEAIQRDEVSAVVQ